MVTINKNALVPYTPEQMFGLVDDINAYKIFLPWCSDSIELERGIAEVKATVELSKGSIKKSFTTHNILKKHNSIEMQLVDGPFKKLHGFWYFKSLQGGSSCKIELDLNYEFSNRLVSMAIGPVFTTVANNLVDSFIERAKTLHG